MSLKDRISPSIYHERQEPDSSLCAQHCLNSLLQDNMFSAADLAEFGRQLDEREMEAREGIPEAEEMDVEPSSYGSRRRQASPPINGGPERAYLNADRSSNMDDSGFFSSQVMDEALKPFNLQLVRWRSERLRPLQETPEEQEAFVLNLSQHWFVIRRFGFSKHFWFDLNSFHPQPKHVSPLYLGLQIDQAEHEGYNVFVVLSSQPSDNDLGNCTLPACEADEAIYSLADEVRLSNGNEALPETTQISDRRSLAMIDDETVFTSSGAGPALTSGFGNEDEQLNRAIEASLKGQTTLGAISNNETSRNINGQVGGASTRNDNEDPELFAAIAASLESEQLKNVVPVEAQKRSAQKKYKELQIEKKVEPQEEEEHIDDEEVPLTAEAMRQARLARFGQ